MKQYIFLISSLALMTACTTENNVTPMDPVGSPDIFGYWQWVESAGGISGDTETSESTGDTKTLHIFEGANNTMDSVLFKTNGEVTIFSAFNLVEKESNYYNEDRWFLVIEESEYEPIVTRINDQLFLTDDVADGYTHVYEYFCEPVEDTAVINKVDLPETGEVNTEIPVAFELAVINSCGAFDEFEISSGDYELTITPKVTYTGCSCNDVIEEFSKTYPFQTDSVGEYNLLFQGKEQVIERKIKIE